VAALPDLPNLVFMAGQKFGTSDNAPQTWAVNAYLPGVIATRFPSARIVAYSTGNVYPLSDARGEGPSETGPTGPVGEYAQSALARERVLEFFSRTQPTRMAILRLNYAIEPRYGVLRDLCDRIVTGQPVDLAMGRVNVIWQRDANAAALRALNHSASPPLVLNLTGRPAHQVKWLAEELGRRLGVEPRFAGAEAETALLSDASRSEALFGSPEVGISEMLDLVAEWVKQGGRSLGRPTHYESREGLF
jgi:nucleoside-diphosphate-sugar epimerase